MKTYCIDKQYNVLRRFSIKINRVLVLVICAVLSVSALVGCWWYNNYYNAAMIVASRGWQEINISLATEAGQPQLDAAQYFAAVNDNNYGVLTYLGLAQQYAELGDFITAQKHLQKAFSQTREANLRSIINLRLARVQLQQKNIDGALKTLEKVGGQGWAPLVEEIRGDVQVVKGDHHAARVAYEKALQFGVLPPTLVCAKLNNLSS